MHIVKSNILYEMTFFAVIIMIMHLEFYENWSVLTSTNLHGKSDHPAIETRRHPSLNANSLHYEFSAESTFISIPTNENLHSHWKFLELYLGG